MIHPIYMYYQHKHPTYRPLTIGKGMLELDLVIGGWAQDNIARLDEAGLDQV